MAAWAAEGGRVVPIPGASAVMAAVAGAGLAGPRWSFEGFLPRSGRERRERLERIARDDRGSILFEAPGRVAATLRDLATACGADRPGAVCRELTKIHESIRRGTLGELAAAATAGGDGDGGIPARGEFVIVVGGLVGRCPGVGGRCDLDARRRARARWRRWSMRASPAGTPRDASPPRPVCRAADSTAANPAARMAG